MNGATTLPLGAGTAVRVEVEPRPDGTEAITLRCSGCRRTIDAMSPKAATWTLLKRALYCPRCPHSRRYRTTDRTTDR